MSNVNIVGLVVVGVAVVMTAIANKSKKPTASANNNRHVHDENTRLSQENHMRFVQGHMQSTTQHHF